VRLLLLLLLAGCAHRAPAWARLQLVVADPEAEVTIDGAPAGKAGEYRKRPLMLSPGRHLIELRSGTARVVREADLGPGDRVALSIDMPGNGGDVR